MLFRGREYRAGAREPEPEVRRQPRARPFHDTWPKSALTYTVLLLLLSLSSLNIAVIIIITTTNIVVTTAMDDRRRSFAARKVVRISYRHLMRTTPSPAAGAGYDESDGVGHVSHAGGRGGRGVGSGEKNPIH